MDATLPSHGSALDLGIYVQRIETDGALFVAAVDRAGSDAPIPTCPGWTMRDLVHHQGEVHRWATAVVAGGLSKPSAVPDDVRGVLPSDDHLASWLEYGVTTLAETLRAAPADLDAFTFLMDAPAPLLFWARRQTYETAMHRVDAESAVGHVTPFVSTFAADGIDELLTGFVPRPRTPLRAGAIRTLSVNLIDDAHDWHVSIGNDAPVTLRGTRAADCTVNGRASDVYLALWNRTGADLLTLEGDPSVFDLFRDCVRVQWK